MTNSGVRPKARVHGASAQTESSEQSYQRSWAVRLEIDRLAFVGDFVISRMFAQPLTNGRRPVKDKETHVACRVSGLQQRPRRKRRHPEGENASTILPPCASVSSVVNLSKTARASEARQAYVYQAEANQSQKTPTSLLVSHIQQFKLPVDFNDGLEEVCCYHRMYRVLLWIAKVGIERYIPVQFDCTEIHVLLGFTDGELHEWCATKTRK